MRTSFSLYACSSAETSFATSVSSSPARAGARSQRAALHGWQEVADRFQVVIGGTAREDLLVPLVHVRVGHGGGAGALQLLGRAHRWGRWAAGLRFGGGVARRKRVLDRGKRSFCRIFDLLWSVCHVRRRLVLRWTRAAAGARP